MSFKSYKMTEEEIEICKKGKDKLTSKIYGAALERKATLGLKPKTSNLSKVGTRSQSSESSREKKQEDRISDLLSSDLP